MTIDNLAFLNI